MFGEITAAAHTASFDLALANPAAAETIAQINLLPIVAMTLAGGCLVFGMIAVAVKITTR